MDYENIWVYIHLYLNMPLDWAKSVASNIAGRNVLENLSEAAQYDYIRERVGQYLGEPVKELSEREVDFRVQEIEYKAQMDAYNKDLDAAALEQRLAQERAVGMANIRQAEVTRRFEAEALARQQAGAQAEFGALETEAEKQFREQIGRQPSAESVSAPFIEGLREGVSPAAQSYYQRRLPDIFQQQGLPEQRRQWWETMSEFPGLPFGPQDLLQKPFVQTEPMPLSLLPKDGLNYAAEAKNFITGTVAKRKRAVDPWQQFLASQNFLEQFSGLTPEERGFRSSQWRPRTRRLS